MIHLHRSYAISSTEVLPRGQEQKDVIPREIDERDVLPPDVAPCWTPRKFRYPEDPDGWEEARTYFIEEGYLVFEDFMTQEDVDRTIALFIDDVKRLCPSARNVRTLNDISVGMINQNIAKHALLGSISYGNAAWKMRLFPRKVESFAHLLDCKQTELVTCLDTDFFAPMASDECSKPPQRLAFTGCFMKKQHISSAPELRKIQKCALAVCGVRTTTHWASTAELSAWSYKWFYAAPERKVGDYNKK